MSLDLILKHKNLTLIKLTKKKSIFLIQLVYLFVKNNGQFIMHQIARISLVHSDIVSSKPIKRYQQRYVDRKNFEKLVSRCQKIIGNKDDTHYNFQ